MSGNSTTQQSEDPLVTARKLSEQICWNSPEQHNSTNEMLKYSDLDMLLKKVDMQDEALANGEDGWHILNLLNTSTQKIVSAQPSLNDGELSTLKQQCLESKGGVKAVAKLIRCFFKLCATEQNESNHGAELIDRLSSNFDSLQMDTADNVHLCLPQELDISDEACVRLVSDMTAEDLCDLRYEHPARSESLLAPVSCLLAVFRYLHVACDEQSLETQRECNERFYQYYCIR